MNILQIRTAGLDKKRPDDLVHIPRVDVATVTAQAITVPSATTALLITSPNGAATVQDSKLPAYVVGPGTAAAYAHTTFTGPGDGVALAAAIVNANIPPQHFFHPHGDLAHLNWYKTLQAAGHTITPQIAYTTTFIPMLTPAQQEDIQKAKTILCLSQTATHQALSLAQQAGLGLEDKMFLCISAQVADTVKKHVPTAVVKIAPSPTALALKNMLD